jgi:hypothetical protein
MGSCERAGLQWTEEPVTEILLSRSAPGVQFAQFTKHEEAKVGADWLWWWVGPGGESFGMLVQAKRLNVKGSKWHFLFDHNHGKQRKALWESAEALDVTPVYVLYLGTQKYRDPSPCGATSHAASDCPQCEALAVSLMPALLADSTFVTDAVATYSRSVSLERAIDRAEQLPSWLGAVDAQLSDELRTFLTTPQAGVRAVARSLVDRVLKVREGQLSKGVAEIVHPERLGPVFPVLPGDRGHWPEPYLPLMLRGLTSVPPDYVVSMIAGMPLGDPPAPNVSGVVLIQINE